MNYRHILAACALTLGVNAAQAAPAYPYPVTYTQPDGTAIKVQIRGDEHSHSYFTPEGTPLARLTNGQLVRADLNPTAPTVMGMSVDAPAQPMGTGLHSTTFTRQGNVKACVILVQFSDVKFTKSDPKTYYNNFLNYSGFVEDGATGCVAKYFEAQSQGQFKPQFDVYGPVTLGARSGYASSSNAYKMVHEACASLDSQVDFSQYDVNGSGDVDNVYIIYAGQGANTGASNAPWPHNSTCPNGAFTKKSVDGKLLYHYACAPEKQSDTAMDGIGTFVHEFGHVLGLSDIYSTVAQNDGTPGFWDVMDVGCYLNSSHTPCNFSAYERVACDWMSLTDLGSDPATVILRGMHQTNFAVQVQSGRTGDYFILENRPLLGWDARLYGTGMLIWHIDASSSALTDHPNNDDSHRCVDLIRADGVASNATVQQLAGDVYPGTSNNTSFTGTSSPAMLRWNSSSGSGTTAVADRPITNITKLQDGTITFDYKGGSATRIVDPTPATRYTISAVASPAKGGTVYIGPAQGVTSVSLEENQSTQLHAEASQYYYFSKWLNPAGEQVSTSTTLYITASQASQGQYTAVFLHRSDAPAEYCEPEGTQSGTYGRYINSITLSTGTTTVSTGTLQPATGSALYHDNTSTVIAAKQGSTITVTPSGVATWAHSYLYVDWDKNGFNYNAPTDYLDPDNNYAIRPGVDLVYYSRWSPQGKDPNAGGTWYTSTEGKLSGSESHNFNATTPISFTIPAEIAPGTYRLRFKAHWGSLDPCGGQDADPSSTNAIAAVDGIIADMTLRVDAADCYMVSVSASPSEDGRVWIGDNQSATQAQVSTVAADRSATLHARAAHQGAQFKQWTKDGVTVSTDEDYTINTVDETTQGQYVAEFESNPDFSGNGYPMPNGGMCDTYYLVLARTTGSGITNHLWYQASEHPGCFHNIISAENAPNVTAGNSFTLNLTANTYGDGNENMRYSLAHLFTDWSHTGAMTLETRYGSTWADNNAKVMQIGHQFTVPDEAPSGLAWIRAIYAYSYGTDITKTTATSTNIVRGVSYDFPVMVLSSQSALGSIDAQEQGVTVTGRNGLLYVTCTAATELHVTDMTGRSLLAAHLEPGINTYALPAGNLYLVRVGSTVAKVML